MPASLCLRLAQVISVVLFGALWASASADFGQCIADVRVNKFGSSGVLDFYGNPVSNVSNAQGLTLPACEAYCGTSHAQFQWFTFSQEFSSWLLPWLALSSQLPFGGTSRLENALAGLLVVGSPALAVYSLSLTVLQRRWIERRFAGMSTVVPNARLIQRVLIALQQASVVLADTGVGRPPLLESLIVLPENDRWWHSLAQRIERAPMWTASAGFSIFWVVLALGFTIVDSIASPARDISNHGHAVGAVWLWLVPVVAGWLQARFEPDPGRLVREVAHANENAYVASENSDEPVLARMISQRQALTVTLRVRTDADRPAPIFAGARIFKGSAVVEKIASMCDAFRDSAEMHVPVSAGGTGDKQWAIGPCDDVQGTNRRGSAEQVRAYCAPRDPHAQQSRWAPGVFRRIARAAACAMFMQWSTTGAAIAITYLTPTIGLGCRSGSFLIYGFVATVSWAHLVFASILAHAAEGVRPGIVSKLLGSLEAFLRVSGKVLASCNAVWLVTLCIFQFSGFYSTCYCMSSAWSRGANAYVVFPTWDELAHLGARTVWIVGVIASGAAGLLYAVFLYFMTDTRELEEQYRGR
ncbi:hypothetical protein AURDEDRAFT_116328 [Auricularia subglabra TFB-10046 SS5]|nr:hypothetical protein AURDEDRAFT_116328 [Auricularia subglabra TFB-10046 SS5]